MGGYSKARLIFDQAGYYQLTSEALIKQGVNVDSLSELALFYRGDPYPFWFSQGASVDQFSLYFYIPAANDRYNSQQVMMVDVKAPLGSQLLAEPLPKIANTSAAVSADGISTLSFEENNEYLPKSGMDDPFKWVRIEEKDAFTFIPMIDELDGKPQRLTLTFWSPSSASVNPDHGIRLVDHNSDWGEFDWEGSGEHQVERILGDIDVQNGIKLEITTRNPTNLIAQLVYLDRIDIEIQKSLRLNDVLNTINGEDQLWKAGPAAEHGFLIEQCDDVTKPHWKEITQDESVIFQGRQGCTYTWLPVNDIHSNFQVQPYHWEDDLASSDHSIDWLVIVPGDFMVSMEPLIAHRKSQGLQTLIIDSQQIYDQFYSGLPHPQALMNFLTEVNRSWIKSPRYVLLIGDYSYLPKKYNEALREIPSVFIPSELIGETVSDLPLADINHDRKPDYSIGRIPAQNPEMLSIWIAKSIANENAWQAINERSILAISDGQESFFASDAKQFLNQFSTNYQTNELDIVNNDQDAGSKVVSAIDPSIYLITYFGHGSIDTWGKDQILNGKIINQLPPNLNLPIYMNMTCLSGYFIHPIQESLAEKLLFQKSSGAVTVIAPTSLTTADNQKNLSDNFAEQIQDKTNKHLGEVMLKTWQNMDSSNDAIYEVMLSFMLFGDPALPIN